MEEGFELPVMFKGEELLLAAKLIRFGYSYRIEVEVNGAVVSFERDEERNWRALVDPSQMDGRINGNMINSIIESLDSI